VELLAQRFINTSSQVNAGLTINMLNKFEVEYSLQKRLKNDIV